MPELVPLGRQSRAAAEQHMHRPRAVSMRAAAISFTGDDRLARHANRKFGKAVAVDVAAGKR